MIPDQQIALLVCLVGLVDTATVLSSSLVRTQAFHYSQIVKNLDIYRKLPEDSLTGVLSHTKTCKLQITASLVTALRPA